MGPSPALGLEEQIHEKLVHVLMYETRKIVSEYIILDVSSLEEREEMHHIYNTQKYG